MNTETNKKSAENLTTKSEQKKNNFLPFITVAIVAVCIVIVCFVKGNGNNTRGNNTAGEDGDSDFVVSDDNAKENTTAEVVVLQSGETLVIQKSGITDDASFFSVEVDGTKMEVLAVKDSNGDIRTAFNTCQVCYDSGRGYYVQSGHDLVCQNCGNRFSMDQVEIESGGCNPWPIFDENKTVTDDEISISYEFLAEAQDIFSRWKSDM